MQIVDLRPDDISAIYQVATLLVEGFATNSPEAWPNIASALEEVRESFETGRISRIALDENGTVYGWIGGICQYDGNVWELHPLVVRVSQQGKGIGSALVADFEERVKERGGLTVTLGTDDVSQQTTLSGITLFPNVWEHVAQIRNLKQHPYEFYQKRGYVIVGVMPDANGPGKPDILMAKSVIT
ncbi:MAG TPA: GNAT family N-acetyltransferase [Ktedonobacteraceae bacterium]|nr:GNAT family N-acetyltransferase [Ktedonobacteraceae bacterium]